MTTTSNGLLDYGYHDKAYTARDTRGFDFAVEHSSYYNSLDYDQDTQIDFSPSHIKSVNELATGKTYQLIYAGHHIRHLLDQSMTIATQSTIVMLSYIKTIKIIKLLHDHALCVFKKEINKNNTSPDFSIEQRALTYYFLGLLLNPNGKWHRFNHLCYIKTYRKPNKPIRNIIIHTIK